MINRADAKRIADVAQELEVGFATFPLAVLLMRHPSADRIVREVAASVQPGEFNPASMIQRRDGSTIFTATEHYLKRASKAAELQAETGTLWAAFALTTLGDALAGVDYLDRSPDLEVVRHLRNAVAHGNRFHFTRETLSRPAYFAGASGRFMPDGTLAEPEEGTLFEITPSLHGQRALFDFLGPGDLCDLFSVIGWRLFQVADGVEAVDLYPQRTPAPPETASPS